MPRGIYPRKKTVMPERQVAQLIECAQRKYKFATLRNYVDLLENNHHNEKAVILLRKRIIEMLRDI